MSNERRAALEAAFDAAEAEEEGLETELEEVPDDDEGAAGGESGTEGTGDEGTDSTGMEGSAAKSKPKDAKTDPQKVEQEAANRSGGKKPGAVQKPGTQGTVAPSADGAPKPPQSWTPAEREHWGKMPKEAQAAVQRRELEVQQVLSRSADSRKFQDQFVKTVQPYAHLIRAQNSHPLQAVNNLMQTAAGLMTGNQPQKAAIVAEIIANYGVDIQTLDDVLSKRPVQQGKAPNELPAPVAEALRPIHEFMSRAEQARSQQIQHIQADAVTVVEKFGETAPFFDDLREDMADIMEVAASRGKILTVEQAHARALAMNPEIQAIVAQRAKAAKLNSDPAKLARARKAGSSIKGAPANGAGGGAKPNSRRAALSEAWDDAS
jgi:hypothetical protein